MRSSAQEKLLGLLFKTLKPLVHLLLEAGIGHREFSEIAKKAFVEVSTENYGIRGRATNVSRVAVMTGLTRKEVKKIRDGLATGNDAPDVAIRPIPASVVLYGWHEDSDFSDGQGTPKTLPFAEGENSFNDLVKKYAGDIPPGAIRAELKRTGAIQVLDDGRLQVLRRSFSPAVGVDRLHRAVARPLKALLLNIKNNNLDYKGSKTGAQSWPEGIVSVSGVTPENEATIRRHTRERIESFCAQLDAELHGLAGTNLSEEKNSSSFGVGIYYFEN